MAKAPEDDCDEGGQSDEPLGAGEAVFDGADGHDCGAAAGFEADEQDNPDCENGQDAHGDGDEEPCSPADCWVHVFQCNDVLRRCDW